MKQVIPSVDTNQNLEEAEKLIGALEYQLSLNTSELDKEIYKSAINILKLCRNALLAEKKSAK